MEKIDKIRLLGFTTLQRLHEARRDAVFHLYRYARFERIKQLAEKNQ